MIAFTTGAHIVPKQLPDGKWHWVVYEFGEDTFDEDGKSFNPDVVSDTENGLIKHFDFEDDDIQPE